MAPIKTNNPYASYFDFFSRTGKDAVTPVPPPVSGLTATGGVISDYEDSGTYYRAHVFTSLGTFDVTGGGTLGNTIDYLLVGGGGGGGSANGGGGGAGEVLYKTSISTPGSFPSPFSISIGAGGGGQTYGAHGNARNPGGDTTFALGSVGAAGGGAGGTGFDPGPENPGKVGGSGGGGGCNNGTGGTGSGVLYPGSGSLVSPDAGWGGDGGTGSAPGGTQPGGGGGGAGGNGHAFNASPYVGGGGSGITIPAVSMSGTELKVGGGGGGGGPSSGGATNNPAATDAGGASVNVGNNPSPGGNGTNSTGGGGGGGGQWPNSSGGSGGSGIVVVRYQIKQNQPLAKATGGNISFYETGGVMKTIHAFTGSGTFATTSGWSATDVEYVVIGGGGGGGGNGGVNGAGGGGAGTYRTGSTPIGAHPVSTSIQVGAGGVGGQWPATKKGATGTPSYFGTPITSPGGGGGGSYTGYHPGDPGGSSGGSGVRGDGSSSPTTPVASATGASFPGTIGATPSVGWGHQGGAGSGDTGLRQGGGGGGAGGAGAAGTNSSPYYGEGGVGIQMPSTFRDPAQNYGAPGPTSPSVTGADTSGKYYVAGGGAGANQSNASVSGGAGGGGPFSTGIFAQNGAANTGGGGSASGSPSRLGATGGDGLVLIAYPT